MRFIDNFSYQLYGHESNKKLVFLHGLMGSGQNWRRIVTSFEADFHILTYDQRGHGRSYRPPTGYQSEDYAADLRKILDELGWAKIDLVGHSMGGRNSIVFAAQNPDRVEKLVIEDIGPYASPAAISRIRKLLDLIPTPFATKAQAKSYLMGEFIQKIQDEMHPQTLAQFFYTNLIQMEDGQVNWRFYRDGILQSVEAGRNQDRSPLLKQINCPTLVVRGEQTDEFPRAEYVQMIAANPRFRGVEIPNSGHWVHFEQPEAFIKVLREFFYP